MSLHTSAPQPKRGFSQVCGEFHVLAVDDSTSDRKIVERLLKLQSYKVTTAKNAIHALEILGLDDNKQEPESVNKFNLIITDYSMPGMNGGELLRRVKEAASLQKIPVIIMSSENISSRKKKCLDEGAEDYLIKPLRVEDISRINCFVKKSGQVLRSAEYLDCELSSMSVGILVSGSEDNQSGEENPPLTLSGTLRSKSPNFRVEKRGIEKVFCEGDEVVPNGAPKRSRLMRHTSM